MDHFECVLEFHVDLSGGVFECFSLWFFKVVALALMWASLVAQLVKLCLQCSGPMFDPWVEKTPWRRKWQATPVFLPGESQGQRRQAGCSPEDLKSRIRLSDETTT